MSIERLSSSWLLRCLDAALVVLAVTGVIMLLGEVGPHLQGYATARPMAVADLATLPANGARSRRQCDDGHSTEQPCASDRFWEHTRRRLSL